MPKPEIPPTRHDRAGIVAAALRLLDEHGLPDLSMRRLATTLGVQPSALYWHFENKQSLLAAVADRIVAAAGTDATRFSGDDETLAACRALRTALLAHRDGAEVVISTRALGLGADAAQGRIAEAIARSRGDAVSAPAAALVLQFVLGHASLVQQRIQAAALGAIDADPSDVAADTSAEFEWGLRVLLAGLDQPASAAARSST